MPRNILAGLVAALFTMILTPGLQAQTNSKTPATEAQQNPAIPKETALHKIAQLEEQAREAFENEKWVRFYSANMKLHQLAPYETKYLVNVVRASSLVDRKNTAYNFMYELQQQGFSYDFNTLDDTTAIRDTEAYAYINQMLIDAGKPLGEAEVAFSLPGNPSDFSAFAWDPGNNRFLVGTTRDGVLLSVSPEGEVTELLRADSENGIWSITGLDVDAANNRLWMSTTALPAFGAFAQTDYGHGALIELNLDTLEVVGRYNSPVDGLPHELGAVTATEDGHVYVIDSKVPLVFLKRPEAEQLEAFFANPEMLGLVDIVASRDNSRIFIADRVQGIMVIDPIARQAAMLSGPKTMNLGGIAGLEYHQGKLFVIQGGFSPQRVVKLILEVDGVTVESVAPMAIALEQFDHPGLASIQDENLYYFANAGLEEDAPAVVMSTPLAAGIEIAPPNMDSYEKAMKTLER